MESCGIFFKDTFGNSSMGNKQKDFLMILVRATTYRKMVKITAIWVACIGMGGFNFVSVDPEQENIK